MRITDELTKRQILERKLSHAQTDQRALAERALAAENAGEVLKEKNQRLREALEELIGAAEHCGDGDAPVVIRARAALD